MADTVYLLGAGINRNLSARISSRDPARRMRPPLATDFFQEVLQVEELRIGMDNHRRAFQSVYDYIERYWKLSCNDLKTVRFDLEEYFTLIQLQQSEADQEGNIEEYRELTQIYSQLLILLSRLFSQFDVFSILEMDWERQEFAKGAEAFQTLGRLILEESAAVLTFNYDLLIESAIEQASGMNPEITPISVAIESGTPITETSNYM